MTEDSIIRALRNALREQIPDARRHPNHHGFGVLAVAKRVGISHSYVSMLLRGRSKSLAMLLRCAEAVGVRVELRINGKAVE